MIADKYEAYTISGFGRAPKCVLPGRSSNAKVAPGASLAVWFRQVYYDRTCRGVPADTLRLDVVTSTGVTAEREAATVEPALTVTDAQGFSRGVSFVARTPGVYRVRSRYRDKRAEGISLSPYIVVLSADR